MKPVVSVPRRATQMLAAVLAGLRAGVPAAVLAGLLAGALLGACGPLSPSTARPFAPASSSAPRTAGARELAPAPPSAELPTAARPLGYRLHLEVDPGAPSFTGDVEIEVELDEPAQRLTLHAVALVIDRAEVEAGGQRWVPRRVVAAAPLLHLELGRQVPAGRLVVRLRYRGVTTVDEQGLFRQEAAGRDYLYSQAEAQYARRIAPCFDEPRHKVPWQVSVTAPADARVFANGAALRDEPLPDGRHRVDFAATAPMPSYLLAIAAGPFRVVELGRLGRARFVARVVVPQGLGATGLAESVIPRAVAAVERWLELPLPLAKLDVVAVPRFFGAMENPGLITMNADDMLGERGRDAPSDALGFTFARVLVHELAHQWFGNLVTPAGWGDLWISEALATWVAQQPFPELPELDPIYARMASQLSARLADAREPAALRRSALGPERMFDVISYDKGAAIAAMLAHWLGEARFVAALRGFLSAHADGSVTAEQLAAAFGRVEPAASGVLMQALARPGVPEVRFELRCAPAAPPALRLGLRPGSGPLPICVRFDSGEAAAPGRACGVFSGSGELALPSPPGRCPAWVIGNDDLRGYYRMRWGEGDDLRGPLPPPALQTAAEQLGLGWTLAVEVSSGAALDPIGAAPVATGTAELVRHLTQRRVTAAQDLADLELIAALERWILDDELPAWRALVERRAARMLQAVQAQPPLGSELTRARFARMLDLFVDVPWPAALTAPALARVRHAARLWGPAARAVSVSGAGESLERDVRLALRSGRPEVLAELLALAATAAEPDASPVARALPALPASALPALLAALDRGALRWQVAAPALAQLLSRRTAQPEVLAALSSRGEALARELAPVEVQPLLEASRTLCSTEDAAAFERIFAGALAQLPRGAKIREEVVAQIKACVHLRSWLFTQRSRRSAPPPP